MKISSWNINGLRASLKSGLFQRFVGEYDPDILCLQEVKALPDEVSLSFDHYRVLWNPAEKKGYSGTAILTKPAVLSVSNNFPDNLATRYPLVDSQNRDSNREGRLITAEYEDFFVVSVYTPNAKDDLSRLPLRQQAWDPALSEYLRSLQVRKPILVLGDFNVARRPEDLARPKENEGRKGYTKEERAGFESILASGLIDSFRLFHSGTGHYTWWSHWAQARFRNIGWRIDYALISSALRPAVTAADIFPQALGSDHCPISVEINLRGGV